jgi:hypothetical protein
MPPIKRVHSAIGSATRTVSTMDGKRSRSSLLSPLRLYCPARSGKLFLYGVPPGKDAAGLSVPIARVVEIAFEGMHDPVQPCGQRGLFVLYDLVGLLPCPRRQEIYRSG